LTEGQVKYRKIPSSLIIFFKPSQKSLLAQNHFFEMACSINQNTKSADIKGWVVFLQDTS
jgi:hypothetical protein